MRSEQGETGGSRRVQGNVVKGNAAENSSYREQRIEDILERRVLHIQGEHTVC